MTTPELKIPPTSDVPPQEPIVEPEPTRVEQQEQPAEQGQVQTPPPVQPPAPQPQTDPVQPADDQTITITIPASPEQLEDWSKGDPENSLTWFAFFWIRMIKKAFAHGWKVVTGTINQPTVA